MNEWGIPDWRIAEAYGNVGLWGKHRWRWEFYRRRDDLREYFDARAEETYRYWQQFVGKPGFPSAHLRPDDPGFCAIVDTEARKRFGYSPLPNPRIGEQPATVIWPHEHEGAGNIIEGNMAGQSGFRGTFGELLAMADVSLTEEQRVMLRHALGSHPAPLESDEMAVTFDLAKPLDAQIKHARDILRFHQEELMGEHLQQREHRDKWLNYLRARDARDAKSKGLENAPSGWSEIAEVLPGVNSVSGARKAYSAWESVSRNSENYHTIQS